MGGSLFGEGEGWFCSEIWKILNFSMCVNDTIDAFRILVYMYNDPFLADDPFALDCYDDLIVLTL